MDPLGQMGVPRCPGCTPQAIKLSYETAKLVNAPFEGDSDEPGGPWETREPEAPLPLPPAGQVPSLLTRVMFSALGP